MKIVIVGAGLAGAIAYGAMRSHKPLVFDASEPGKTGFDRHKAIMRIRDPSLGFLLGCNLEKINIRKAVLYGGKLHEQPSITTNNLYSLKAYGRISDRSVYHLGQDTRYLIKGAPISPDVVNFGHKLFKITPGIATFLTCDERRIEVEYDFIISTIPIASLIGATKWSNDTVLVNSFRAEPIWVTTVPLKVPSDVHQTIYVPEGKYSSYRVSLEGDRLIYESVGEDTDGLEKEVLASHFGLFTEDIDYLKAKTVKQPLGKLLPAPEEQRKYSIYSLTNRYKVFSLGRFATWKPIRADHLISDIERIIKMINVFSTKHSYVLNKEQV